jgi:hypothetical protein
VCVVPLEGAVAAVHVGPSMTRPAASATITRTPVGVVE